MASSDPKSALGRAYTPNRSLEEIEAALVQANGLVTVAAKMLGMSLAGVYYRLKRSARLQQVVEDNRTELVDKAESNLRYALDKGEAWATQLVLRTIGKDRGYFEKQEVATSTTIRVKLLKRSK